MQSAFADFKKSANIITVHSHFVGFHLVAVLMVDDKLGYYVNGEFIVNPTEKELPESSLDIIVAGHRGGITMVEAGANEASEALLIDALELAQKEINKIVDFIEEMRNKVGRKKIEIAPPARIEEIDEWVASTLSNEIYEAIQIHEKQKRAAALAAISERIVERFAESHPDSGGYIAGLVDEMTKKGVRRLILDDGRRADGREA